MKLKYEKISVCKTVRFLKIKYFLVSRRSFKHVDIAVVISKQYNIECCNRNNEKNAQSRSSKYRQIFILK